MQRRRASLKFHISTNRGTVSPKVIVATAALFLSVCASVFTFLALTKVETWMKSNSAGAHAAPAANRPVGAAAGYQYGDGPSFSAAAPVENTVAETNAETVTDTPPEETFSIQSTPAPAGTEMSGGSSRRRPGGHIPPPQSSSQTSPRSSGGVPFMFNNASTAVNLFALTFDGGSSANAAGDILDTLASRGVKSTVFLTGAFIKRYPQIVTRIAAEGHELGNHTMNHPHLTTYAENRAQTTRPGVSRASLAGELTAAERLLFERAGNLRFAPLWRAPFGEYNREICEWAFSAGYIHIGWRQGGSWRVNLDSNDWVTDESSPAYRTPQEVFDKIAAIAQTPGGLNGGIILMHLGTERARRSEQVHTILGKLIDTLRGMGYKPVTVSTLLYHSGIDIDMIDFDKDF
ncbi:MAG: polysaccharide deacetylase family protein [Chitinispirillales bacterium]|jgi:peptidoglycan/xylan/chitin deacetylase (PgdA/CDA1 family)|nr:polysaccharide deacetylase family protein [Chitinispirillales bacterium]